MATASAHPMIMPCLRQWQHLTSASPRTQASQKASPTSACRPPLRTASLSSCVRIPRVEGAPRRGGTKRRVHLSGCGRRSFPRQNLSGLEFTLRRPLLLQIQSLWRPSRSPLDPLQPSLPHLDPQHPAWTSLSRTGQALISLWPQSFHESSAASCLGHTRCIRALPDGDAQMTNSLTTAVSASSSYHIISYYCIVGHIDPGSSRS
mmetsp:Transcript_16554/g.50874  ORF Transcript_16554/g.50874 Transcript_16554/m.50874 type:complete len:205 (+) Transcript_16554:1717-2331(+)